MILKVIGYLFALHLAHAGIEFHVAGLKPEPAPAAADLKPSLAVAGSLGETLAFVFRTARRDCFRPSVESPLPGLFFRFAQVLPFKTEHPSYKGARVGRYWDPLLPAERLCPTDDAPWMLGEIEISAKAKPGLRRLRLRLGAETAPIELRIWKMGIPDAPAIPLYAELTTWFTLLGHYGKWHEGEAPLAARYIESMLRHRIAPLKHWVREVDLGAERADFKRVNGLPAPDAFEAAVLKPLPAWARAPLPIGQDLDPDAPGAAAKIRKLARGAEQDGWLPRAYAYLWDEPAREVFPRLEKLARLARREAPGLSILVTTEYDARFESLIDIWVPILDQLAKNPAPYAELRRRGKQVWAYSSCVSHGCGNDVDAGSPDWVIDRGGAWVRAQAWLASRYGLDALLYYSVVDGYQHFPAERGGRDPWTDLWDFSGNGDGTLYYPGRRGERGLTADGPVESLRLKLWRESSYDAEYIRWMNALAAPPAWWAPERDRLAASATQWSKSEADYAALRRRAGDYLDGLPSQKAKRKVK